MFLLSPRWAIYFPCRDMKCNRHLCCSLFVCLLCFVHSSPRRDVHLHHCRTGKDFSTLFSCSTCRFTPIRCFACILFCSQENVVRIVVPAFRTVPFHLGIENEWTLVVILQFIPISGSTQNNVCVRMLVVGLSYEISCFGGMYL